MAYQYQPSRKVSYAPVYLEIPPTPFIPCISLPPSPSSPYEQVYLSTPPWTIDQLSRSLSSVASSSSSVPYRGDIGTLDHGLIGMAFDITRDPHPPSNLIPEVLSNPVTKPPVRFLHLHSEFPWEMAVEATICPYITIFDIHQTLFRNVHLPLLAKERERLQAFADVIHANCCNRLRRVVSQDQWCRIDVLTGRTVARVFSFDANASSLDVTFGFS